MDVCLPVDIVCLGMQYQFLLLNTIFLQLSSPSTILVLSQMRLQPMGDNPVVIALGVLFALSLIFLVVTVIVVVLAVLKKAWSGSEYRWHSAVCIS